MSAIPALWEDETGRSQIQAQDQQLSETLSQKNLKRPGTQVSAKALVQSPVLFV